MGEKIKKICLTREEKKVKHENWTWNFAGKKKVFRCCRQWKKFFIQHQRCSCLTLFFALLIAACWNFLFHPQSRLSCAELWNVIWSNAALWLIPRWSKPLNGRFYGMRGRAKGWLGSLETLLWLFNEFFIDFLAALEAFYVFPHKSFSQWTHT